MHPYSDDPVEPPTVVRTGLWTPGGGPPPMAPGPDAGSPYAPYSATPGAPSTAMWPPAPGAPAGGDPRYLPPPPPPPGGPAGRRPWLLPVVVVAAVLVVGLIVLGAVLLVRSGGSSTPVAGGPATASATSDAPGAGAGDASTADPTSAAATTASASATVDPAAQAGALDGLLNASAGARSGVQPALNDIENCAWTGSDVTALQTAASVRQQLMSELGSTDLSALPNGAAMAAALQQAWTASVASDGEFVAWANATAGCVDTASHDDANYTRAMADSAAATAAKEQFVALWNPVAAQYGLTARQASGI